MPPTTPTDPWPLPELTRARRAIVVVDVVESVRLMQEDEAGFIDRWRRFVHQVRTEVLPKHGGRLVKSLGDGMLLEFPAVPSAVSAALEMQQRARSISSDGGLALELRCGIHQADVAVDALDIYGTGVNLAARLAGLAGPGEIVISSQAREDLIQDVDASLEDMGECWLKHMSQPIRAWRAVPLQPAKAARRAAGLTDVHHASIAVLPFVLQSTAECADQMLGELVAEDVSAWLTRVPNLAVVSCLSTLPLRNRAATYPELSALLGVNYVAHGSCMRDGARLRIHAQLIEGSTGRVLWTGTERAEIGDLWHREAPVTCAIAGHVSKALLGSEAARASVTSLPNLESYSILFGAISMLHRLSRREFDRARDMLEHLADRHPRSPVPHAWLGKWYVMRIGQGWSSDAAEDGRRALAATSTALHLDPTHAFSLTMDGFATGYVKKDFAIAEQRYEDALRSNPNESLAWLFRSAMLGYRDQGTQAIECALRAQDLSPIDPMQYYFDHFTSLALLLAGRYEESIAYGLRSIKGNRTHASALRALAMAQSLAGRLDDARATGALLMQLEPQLTLRAFRARYPGQSREQVDRLAHGLELAGVPA